MACPADVTRQPRRRASKLSAPPPPSPPATPPAPGAGSQTPRPGPPFSAASRTSRCSRSGSNEPSRLTDPLYVPVRLVRSSSRVVFSPAILVTLPGDSRTPERKSLTVRVILQEKSGRNVAHPAGMGWRRSVGSESHHTSWRAPRCPCQAPDVPSSRYLHCFRRIVLYHRRR